jgi:hypothetical protein
MVTEDSRYNTTSLIFSLIIQTVGALTVGGLLVATGIGIGHHSIEHIMHPHAIPTMLAFWVKIYFFDSHNFPNRLFILIKNSLLLFQTISQTFSQNALVFTCFCGYNGGETKAKT